MSWLFILLSASWTAGPEAGVRFQISFSDSVRSEAVTGRVYVAISRHAGRRPPIHQAGETGCPLFGKNVDGLAPGEACVIDRNVFGHPLASVDDIPTGTYYVQALSWSPDAWLAGAGVGALSTAILVVNNLRDIETDARAGKRTLAVRMGVRASKAEYVGLVSLGLLVPVVGVLRLSWPPVVLASLLVIPACVSPLRRVLGHTEARALNAALAETARAVGLYGAVMGLALAFG